MRLAGYALQAATGLAAIALMATAGWLLAAAWPQPPILHLQLAIVGVRAFAIGRAALRYLERLVSHRAAFEDSTTERLAWFDRVRPVLPAAAGERSSALLPKAVADVDGLQDLPLRGVGPLVTAGVCAVVTVAVVAVIQPVAALVVTMALSVSGVAATLLALSVARRAERELAPRAAELDAALLDATRARDILVAYDAWGETAARLQSLDAKLATASRRLALAAGAGSAVVLAAGGLAVVGVVVAAAQNGPHGALSALIALVPLALFEIWAAVPAAALVVRQVAARRARLAKLGSAEDVPAETGSRDVPTGALRLRGVTAAWPGTECGFQPVDLDAEPGDVVAVRGVSGVGKSTLAAALVRFLRFAGDAQLGGASIASVHPEAVRTAIVLVEQLPHLFDTTLRENLRLARPEASDAELLDVLARVGLRAWAERRDGLDTRMGDRAALVSGGQAQRIGLARGLLADPSILVLDEPTANVDDATAGPLLRDLLSAAKSGGRAVIVTSHVPLPADLVTRVVELIPRRRSGEPPAAAASA